MSTADALPIAIVDTNALLDWRVFKDPAAQPLAEALTAGRMRWLASPSMEQEWHQVWPRSYLKRWAPDPMLTLTVFQHAAFVDEPPRGPYRCKDPDDQKFIDLAVQHRATLLSKDRAVWSMARRLATLGVSAGCAVQAAPGLMALAGGVVAASMPSVRRRLRGAGGAGRPGRVPCRLGGGVRLRVRTIEVDCHAMLKFWTIYSKSSNNNRMKIGTL